MDSCTRFTSTGCEGLGAGKCALKNASALSTCSELFSPAYWLAHCRCCGAARGHAPQRARKQGGRTAFSVLDVPNPCGQHHATKRHPSPPHRSASGPGAATSHARSPERPPPSHEIALCVQRAPRTCAGHEAAAQPAERSCHPLRPASSASVSRRNSPRARHRPGVLARVPWLCLVDHIRRCAKLTIRRPGVRWRGRNPASVAGVAFAGLRRHLPGVAPGGHLARRQGQRPHHAVCQGAPPFLAPPVLG
jgi:hypothetical protein